MYDVPFFGPIGGDDQELDLAESELALGISGIEGKLFIWRSAAWPA